MTDFDPVAFVFGLDLSPVTRTPEEIAADTWQAQREAEAAFRSRRQLPPLSDADRIAYERIDEWRDEDASHRVAPEATENEV